MNVSVTITADSIGEIAKLLAGLSTGKTAPVKSISSKKPVDEEEPEDEEETGEEEPDEITKDDCRELAGTKKEKGKGPAIIKLLATYNVKSITNLPDKHVKAFHAKLLKL